MNAADFGGSGRAFLDSNVIVYAISDEDRQKSNVARTLMRSLIESRRGVISAQVLGESFVTLTHKGKHPLLPQDAIADIKGLRCFRIVPLTGDLVFRALDIQQEFQLSYWDALIIAAAESAGCATVWSEDLSDGQKYGDVTVRNPFAGG